jgi:virulence factor Mce-like protein
MSSSARKATLALGGTAAAIVAVIVLSSGSGGYYVKAAFRDVGGLRKNSSVKIAGVPAGKVADLKVMRDSNGVDMAVVKLKIDSSAAPIGRDATIQVRPTDLLGERYADVAPGNRSDPMPRGATIGMPNTAVPVELDDVLNTLDADTRTRLGILVNEFGNGLAGRGANLSRLLATMPRSLQQTRALIDQVSSQSAALKSLIVKGDRITASVNGRRDDMGRLVDQASGALRTVAEKRRELGATLENAPGALRELNTTLGRLNTASLQLRPAAVELQRTAAPLNSTLKALPSFADQAAPTLQTARKVAPSLTRLGQQATPTVARLASTADLLKQTLDPASPLLQHMDKRGTDDLLYLVNNVNRGLQGRDGVSHWIGAHFYLPAETVANAINAFNSYQPPAKTMTRQKHETALALPKVTLPKVTLPKLSLPDNLNKLLPIKPALKELTDKVVPLVNGALPQKVVSAVGGITGKVLKPSTGGKRSAGGDALRLFDYLMGP